jgi:hypothetical protein
VNSDAIDPVAGNDNISIDTRVKLADPGFPYVDANNDHLFLLSDGDVLLVGGELDDGFFDTQTPEGAYTTVIPGAGLVINGGPISASGIDYRADGDLVINTDLTATGAGDVQLKSRDGSMLLDDPSITSMGDMTISAALDILSTDDSVEATGANSTIDLSAGRNVVLSGTAIQATRTVYIVAGNSITIGDSLANQGTVKTSDPNGTLRLKARGSGTAIDVSGADFDAARRVTLEARRGDITARDSVFSSLGANGEVKLSGHDIDITGGLLQAEKKVELKAREAIFAEDSSLLTCGNEGAIRVRANDEVELDRATMRAFKNIDVRSIRNDVDLTEADLAIVTGSERGDIEVKAQTIGVTDADIVAPDIIRLKGNVIGTPSQIDKGTKDCP